MADLTLYDPDGLNPYGRELAALLQRRGNRVRLLSSVSVSWAPPGVDVRRALPGTRPGNRPSKALRVLAGLGWVVSDALRGRTVLVCWSWYLVEKLVVALTARLTGRVILIVHNPAGRGRRSALTRWLEKMEQGGARTLVVHSERLAHALDHQDVRVCPHPPYRSYLEAHPQGAPASGDEYKTLLVLGALRPDKGYELLPDLLRRVSSESRRRICLHLVGRDPERGGPLVEALESLVNVRNDLRVQGADDPELIAAVRSADALLAFYPEATQSGSAILALSAGLPVLGFDVGALSEVIDRDFLAPLGDLSQAAQRIEDLLQGRLFKPANVMTLGAWEQESATAWDAAVQPRRSSS